MSLLQILYYPDERLRNIAKPVIQISDVTRCIVNDMLETMYFRQGIGLAATQVNIHKQIIVIDISENHNQHLVLINPQILEKTGNIKVNEGCLSIPKQRGFILRAEKIKVRALDIYGNSYELESNNLLAVCIQHEIDHLIGKLFIDYLSPLKRRLIHQKMKKIMRINIKNK